MSALLELASRVEALEGPSRELDCLIWADVHHNGFEWTEGYNRKEASILRLLSGTPIGAIDPGKRSRNFTCWNTNIPAYTASLDAAMTLIPPEMCLHSLGESRYMVRGPWLAHLVRSDKNAPYDGISASASTAALALVAAALRSRAGASV